jgi:hypothetical protein
LSCNLQTRRSKTAGFSLSYSVGSSSYWHGNNSTGCTSTLYSGLISLEPSGRQIDRIFDRNQCHIHQLHEVWTPPVLVLPGMGCLFSRAEPVPQEYRQYCGVWSGRVTDSSHSKHIQVRLREDGTGSFVYQKLPLGFTGSKVTIKSNCAKFSGYSPTSCFCNSGCGTWECAFSLSEDGSPALVVEGVMLRPAGAIIVPTTINVKSPSHIGHFHHTNFSRAQY